MTFCEMHKPSGCGECPNRAVCQKPINTFRHPAPTHKVIKTSWGGVRREIGVSGPIEECMDFCISQRWVLDEGYIWDLEIVQVDELASAVA